MAINTEHQFEQDGNPIMEREPALIRKRLINLDEVMARRSKFDTKKFKEYVQEYIDEEDEVMGPITLSGLCGHIGYTKTQLINLVQDSNDGELKDIFRAFMSIAEADISRGALMGDYKDTATKFELKNNHGWLDSQVVNHVQPTQITLVDNVKSIEAPEGIDLDKFRDTLMDPEDYDGE